MVFRKLLSGKQTWPTGKCFSLTNFSNGKQTQESLESDFPETTFRETNMAKIIELSRIFVKINSRLIEKTYSRNQTKNLLANF